MNGRILITGGLGYLGGRLAKILAEQSVFRPVLAGRKSPSGPPEWLPGAEVIRLDMLDATSVRDACAGVDYIIHLAALNEIQAALNPPLAFEVRGAGAHYLIEAARAESVAGIINFSTAHVYGAPLSGILTENTVPRPVHPYAIAHCLSENIVLAARDRGGPPGLVLRVSNGFGAPTHRDINRWSLLVNDLCRQAVTNRRLLLKSSGRQVRDFVTIGDIGAAVVFFLTQGTSAWEDGLFNLGGKNSLTILRMAELIAKRCNEVLGFEPEITVAEPPPGETCPDLVYSIDKLEKTGFRLTGDFESELDAELEFCQAEFGAGHLPVNPVK